jgi:hypothetical protein
MHRQGRLLGESLRIMWPLLTYSMEQSPSWETNQFSDSQEIPRNLWNRKVHYRLYKSPPPDVHAFQHYLHSCGRRESTVQSRRVLRLSSGLPAIQSKPQRINPYNNSRSASHNSIYRLKTDQCHNPVPHDINMYSCTNYISYVTTGYMKNTDEWNNAQWQYMYNSKTVPEHGSCHGKSPEDAGS